jgi:hypothetical protein
LYLQKLRRLWWAPSFGDHIIEEATFFFKLDRDIILDSHYVLNLD